MVAQIMVIFITSNYYNIGNIYAAATTQKQEAILMRVHLCLILFFPGILSQKHAILDKENTLLSFHI
jgi:hypothetical protein